ncbi:MAG: folylpolyglutamate synthase/dihydrofolate synthase family protein [Armatimonadota bacterium]
MNYAEAVTYLEALVDHEQLGFRRHMASVVSLDTMRALSLLLGEPHLGLCFAHIAGSKGKGSVAAMIEAMARAAGLTTGLYTSPHLVSPRERLRIDGYPIPEEELAELTTAVRPALEEIRAMGQLSPPTFFEAYTAMALLCFARHRVALAVLETGLGGRFDATNIVTPAACAITSLSLEHTDILGSTIGQIAAEKAGILKPGVPAVVGELPPEGLAVVEERAAEVGAPLRRAPGVRIVTSPILGPDDDPRPQVIEIGDDPPHRYELGLLGDYQARNAAVAVALAEALGEALGQKAFGPGAEAVATGLRDVRWPGRLQVAGKSPRLVLDCAHTPAAAAGLATSLRRYFRYDRLWLVVGMSDDKDVEGFAAALAPLGGTVFACRAGLPRALPPEVLKQRAVGIWDEARESGNVAAAVDAALSEAGPGDLVCVTGSVYVVGEAMQHLGLEPW